MHNIAVFTGTRAEYGLLKRLIRLLKEDDSLETRIIVSGTHLSKAHGNTRYEIDADGFSYDSVEIPFGDDTPNGMARGIAEGILKYSDYLQLTKPNILVVLGDRYEALAATIAAFLHGIPIAHISGGDVTEGALDDGFRNCITQMASLHFPGNERAAMRLRHMGVRDDAIYSVGDPGIENCIKEPLLPLEVLNQELGTALEEGNYFLVTLHAETKRPLAAEEQMRSLIAAMEQFPNQNFLITLANSDPGGQRINQMWEEEKQLHSNWIVRDSLGMRRYLSAVKYASAVVGNSSSGIVETPVVGTPSVNIGIRQQGRHTEDCVISCNFLTASIAEAMKQAVSVSYREAAGRCAASYHSINTAEKIKEVLKEHLLQNAL